MTMKVTLTQTAFNKAILAVSENTNVDIFNGTLTGLTITAMKVLGTGGELCDFNPANGKFIVYDAIKNDPIIANAQLIEFTFSLTATDYGTYPITIKRLSGMRQSLAVKETIGDVNAVMAIKFSQADLLATVAQVIGKGTAGIDANKDGNIDILDVQQIVNNL
jgi:hypothetical protein